MDKLKKIPLDSRDLEHPVPLERAMKILQELNDETYLYMLHRKNPIPLLDFAQERGYAALSKEDEHGDWHIIICTNENADLETLVNA